MNYKATPSTAPSDALIEGLGCAVIVINSEHIVQRVNIAAEALFVQSRRHLIGQKLDDLVASDAVLKYLTDCSENNTQFTLREVEIKTLNKSSLVDMTISSLTTADNQSQGLLIEINTINRISRFMKEANQLERQQSFRLMMRGLAHEIKNPLGGIRGAAQLLEREIQSPEHKELTDILIKEADRLTRLVDRVMGSREQLKPSYLNIHEVLEHVIHLVTVKNSSQLHVSRFYDPALPEIKVDREQMIQAILNVVGNAIDAQQDSELAKLGLVTRFERFVTINQVMYRQVLNIKIWDEGPGVPTHMRDILFDPLITGRPDGTGLGLSITQEIIQRHKGLVQLEDYYGNTCFSFYLPYINGDETQRNYALGKNDSEKGASNISGSEIAPAKTSGLNTKDSSTKISGVNVSNISAARLTGVINA